MTTHQAAHVAVLEELRAALGLSGAVDLGKLPPGRAAREAIEAAIAALTASPQEAQEGEWYTNPDTGSHCVDWDGDPKRQLSILLKNDGSVGFAAYAYGQRFHGDAMSEDFWHALAALASPQVQGGEALTTKLREILDERVEELAQRLVASGPKAAHVSASGCHEITDAILDARAALASGPSGVDGLLICRCHTDDQRRYCADREKCSRAYALSAAAQDQGEGNGR